MWQLGRFSKIRSHMFTHTAHSYYILNNICYYQEMLSWKGFSLTKITFLWPFGKNLWINVTSKSFFFPTSKTCHIIKFDPVFDPDKSNCDVAIGRIKFAGLYLAVEIQYTYQTPPQPGGWWWLLVVSVDYTRKCYVTCWVNNIKWSLKN